jgi:hypothetical protein
MHASGRSNDAPERRLVDHLTKLEQQLLEASTRRIHEFERRIELEWEALRQLHEERLKSRSGARARIVKALTALAVAVVILTALIAYAFYRIANQTADSDRSARQAQQHVASETASLKRELSKRSTDLETAVRANQRALNVLAAADIERFPLHGRRAPAAGQALWSRSRGLLLEAVRVPPPSAGEMQQVWVVTTRGSIGLGFILPDKDGRVLAAFEAPREVPGAVLGVIVTTETAGGGTSPSRRFILAPPDP